MMSSALTMLKSKHQVELSHVTQGVDYEKRSALSLYTPSELEIRLKRDAFQE